MRLSEINSNTHFVQINLSDLLEQLGEDEVKNILSSFVCPLNADVEKFVKTKAVEFSRRGFSKRKLREHGIFDTKSNEYTVAAPLIAQLGKNYANGNNSLISGRDLLQMAMEKVKKVQNEVGGRFVYLECEEKPRLMEFYESNHFKIFGRRKLDRDETDIEGKYLLQYFTIL